MADIIIIDEAADITPEQVKAVLGEPKPPSILSIELGDPHYHPCYVRVGVRIDGEERNDIAYYNLNNRSYKTNRDTSHLAQTIEPYWRYQPSRQQRRAEERWERKRR